MTRFMDRIPNGILPIVNFNPEWLKVARVVINVWAWFAALIFKWSVLITGFPKLVGINFMKKTTDLCSNVISIEFDRQGVWVETHTYVI